MLVSMTGYGKAEERCSNFDVYVEMKSLNNRYIDIISKVDERIYPFENEIISLLRKKCLRGKVYLNISVKENKNSIKDIKINNNKLNVYMEQIKQIQDTSENVIFPIHPRTKNIIDNYNMKIPSNINMINPVGWFDLMNLIKGANYIFTDSGGMQKEAFWHNKICFTLRNETEWIETVKQDANFIINENRKINLSVSKNTNFQNPYGDGNASEKIVSYISKNYS